MYWLDVQQSDLRFGFAAAVLPHAHKEGFRLKARAYQSALWILCLSVVVFLRRLLDLIVTQP